MSKRPFRLHNATLNAAIRWRYYSDSRRAHMGALYEARWGRVNEVVEVLNIDNGHLLGQYRMTVDSIEVWTPKQGRRRLK